jgi:uncharacterized protein (TIGR02646 family)
MKHIVKGPEPVEFLAWKALANEDWSPSYDVLQHPVKTSLKNSLSAEQGYLCCYCESHLDEGDSHIEHVQPQHLPKVDALDYSNMACSCLNQIKKGEALHCGAKKGDWFDATNFVSPFDPRCERRFVSHANGTIHPLQGDPAAKCTIEKLGLDIPKLQSMRASAIEPFLDETLSEEDLIVFLKGYLARDAQGGFGPYWTAIRYIFENLGLSAGA